MPSRYIPLSTEAFTFSTLPLRIVSHGAWWDGMYYVYNSQYGLLSLPPATVVSLSVRCPHTIDGIRRRGSTVPGL